MMTKVTSKKYVVEVKLSCNGEYDLIGARQPLDREIAMMPEKQSPAIKRKNINYFYLAIWGRKLRLNNLSRGALQRNM